MSKPIIIIIILGLLLIGAIKDSFDNLNNEFEEKWKENESTSYKLNAIMDGHVIP